MGNLFGFFKNNNLKCTKKSHTHITLYIFALKSLCISLIWNAIKKNKKYEIMDQPIILVICLQVSSPFLQIIFYVFIRGLRTNQYILWPQSNLPLAKGEQIIDLHILFDKTRDHKNISNQLVWHMALAQLNDFERENGAPST